MPGEPVAWWERWAVLRLLHQDRAFAWMILGVLLGGCLILAASVEWVPGRRWPDGQAWTMSGWDWLRCQWHDHRMGGAGRPGFRADTMAWSRRVGWDPADPGALRGYLDSMTSEGISTPEAQASALRWGRWLWRVEGTNRSDVGRVFRLLVKTESEEPWGDSTDWWGAHLAGAEHEEWTRKAADRGLWPVVGRSLEARADASQGIGLIALAWKAGWGPVSEARAGFAQLESVSAAGGPQGIEADRLLLQVNVARSDIAGAERVLRRMIDRRCARLIDRVRLGQLLAGNGGGETLRRAVGDWPMPEAKWEVEPFVNLMLQLGDTRQSIRVLVAATDRWNESSWWYRLSDLLWQSSDWQGMRELGTRLRGDPGHRMGWEAVGWRLEALGLEGLGRSADASDAWKQGDSGRPLTADAAWEWGRRFLAWGHVRRVADWLRSIEIADRGEVEYWQARHALALLEGDAEERLAAVLRLRALAPLDPSWVTDQAWALLALRRNPAEVIKLVELDGGRSPAGSIGRIQEALAWVQLGNLEMAEAQLRALPREGSRGFERTMICLGLFEVHARRRRVMEAIDVYREIEGRFLVPVQLRWLEGEYHRIVGLQRQPLGESGVETQ